MADWLIDPQLVDVVWLDDCRFSFQLDSGINRCQAYGEHLNNCNRLNISYKAHISTQADDDDGVVSSLTPKLRYSKHTQHTAFKKKKT